jgi:predicted enzyme related to lactoylglutathione lyase
MVDEHLAKHGKISYIEIPALDAAVSGAFYEAVFGFHLHGGSPERVSFKDAPHDLIGAFTRGRTPSATPGVMPWIYVASVEQTLERVRAQGRKVVMQPSPEGDTLLATFLNPAGNLIGIWQAN